MKLVLGMVVLSTLVACGTESVDRPTKQMKSESPALSEAESVEEVEEVFTPQQVEETMATAQTTEPMPVQEVQSMEQSVSELFSTMTSSDGKTMDPELAAEGSGLVMGVMDAAQSGNPIKIAFAANKLTSFAKKQEAAGLGLVDVAGVIDAIQDLVAAIIDADAAGILDAIQDLVAAILD